MKHPIFAVIDGTANVYYDHDSYHRDTFSPDCVISYACHLCATGKNYAERRESIRNLAIDVQAAMSEAVSSYATFDELSYFFTRYGRRYGLLKEFYENAIC